MALSHRQVGVPAQEDPLSFERLGVLGGSFNPIHLGHLHLARQCREMFGLSRVLFTVAAVPPHKPLQDLIPFAHRYAMTCLATAGHPAFVPSMIELEPPVSGYSVDTLAKIGRRFGIGGSDIFFVAGGDSLVEVAGWRSSDELLANYNFIFVMRPGVHADHVVPLLPPASAARIVDCRRTEAPADRIAAALSEPGRRIFLIDTGAPDISSSRIRSLCSEGGGIDQLVPAAVVEYIQKLHLYGE